MLFFITITNIYTCHLYHQHLLTSGPRLQIVTIIIIMMMVVIIFIIILTLGNSACVLLEGEPKDGDLLIRDRVEKALHDTLGESQPDRHDHDHDGDDNHPHHHDHHLHSGHLWKLLKETTWDQYSATSGRFKHSLS